MLRGFLFFALICTFTGPLAHAKKNRPFTWNIARTWSPENSKLVYTAVLSAKNKGDRGIWLTKPGEKPKQIVQGRVFGYPDTEPGLLEENMFEVEGMSVYAVGAASDFGLAVVLGEDDIQLLVLREKDAQKFSLPLEKGVLNESFAYDFTQDGRFLLAALRMVDANASNHANLLVVAIESGTNDARVLGRAIGSVGAPNKLKIDGRQLSNEVVEELFRQGQPATLAEPAATPAAAPARPVIPELKDPTVTDQDGDRVSAIEIVSQFTRNLTAQFSAAPMKGVTVDEDLKNKIKRGFLKIERGSVAVLGPSGSGKTVSAEAVISDLVNDTDLPEELQGYTFLELNAASLASGTKYVGTQSTKINAMLELSRANKIIWLVDEVHTLRGLGTSAKNGNDVLESMKKGLTDGTLRILALSTEDEFWAAFESDRTVVQRFTIAKKEAPQDDELVKALNNWLSRHNLTAPAPSQLETIIQLSTEMDPLGAQPRKSVSLLEEIYSQLKFDKRSKDAPTDADIAAAAQSLYGLDPAYLDPESFPQRLVQLSNHLNENIVGQPKAKKALIEQTRQIFAGLQDKNKPRVMALFTGPKGRGKTELAMAYAKGLGLPSEVIEMNSYASSNGFDRVGLMAAIAQALNKNAFTVLIFDEVEKAPIAVQNEVLRLFASGEFTVSVPSKGDPLKMIPIRINARNSSVILTTNAGSDHLRATDSPAMGFSTKPTSAAPVDDHKAEYLRDQALRSSLVTDGISEFLLDRLPLVIPFDAQTADDFKAILANHLQRALRSSEQGKKGLKITTLNEDVFLNKMAQIYYDPQMSNRDVLRIIGSQIRTALTDAFFGKKLVGDVTIDFAEGHAQISCSQLLEATPDEPVGK